MDLIVTYFPTYSEKGMYTATSPNDVKVELMTSEKEVLTAQVFKTIIDPFVGRISYVKVLSGVLSSDSVVSNANNGKPEKVGTIFIIKGKHQTAAGKLFTGDIGAIQKLQYTKTNDTLCEKESLLWQIQSNLMSQCMGRLFYLNQRMMKINFQMVWQGCRKKILLSK